MNKDQMKTAGALLLFLLLLGTLGALIITGIFQEFSINIGKLGFIAHVIFLLFFIQAGCVFGWGYAVTVQILGYVFGWKGLITSEIGTFLGGVLGFVTSRYCLKQWSLTKIQALSEHKQQLITIARKQISNGRTSIIFFSMIRMTPVLTFGFVNALCGALTEMNYTLYMFTLMVGHQMDIMVYTFVGLTLRQAMDLRGGAGGDGGGGGGGTNMTSPSSSMNGSSDVEEISLIIRIVLAIFLLIGTTLWSRYLLKKIIKNSSNDNQIHVDDEKVTGGEINRINAIASTVTVSSETKSEITL
jgi:uncharacterized membrane protein YdjX (TVP38/TMEM64 family)